MTVQRVLALGMLAATASAQTNYVDYYATPPRFDPHPGLEHRDDGFTFCRLKFRDNRKEADGSGWNTDFPKAGWALPIRLGEITTMRVSEPTSWVMDVSSRELSLCPLVFVSDGGVMALTIDEVGNLSGYLSRGGLMWWDDSWGTASANQIADIIRSVAPRSWTITPGFDHPIYRMHYQITETLQVSHIGNWNAGKIQERGPVESPLTPLQIVVDEQEHVLAVITHNSDIADAWEQDGGGSKYFWTNAPASYALATNLVIYAMTH